MNKETCTIKIILSDDYNRELGFELEDAVKEAWNRMIPWFTRRHGITKGSINLENGAVQIDWSYERSDDTTGESDECNVFDLAGFGIKD